MFSLTVSDHIMVAHSFRGAGFGPAQRVHGATFVVEAEFRAPRLDGANLLVDIALARAALRRVLDGLDYRNLDEVPELAGRNTTTEFLCALIHGMLAAAIGDGRLGEGARAVAGMKVTLRESPLAWASYEAPLPGRPGAGEYPSSRAAADPARGERSAAAFPPADASPASLSPTVQAPEIPTAAELTAMLRALSGGTTPSGSLP